MTGGYNQTEWDNGDTHDTPPAGNPTAPQLTAGNFNKLEGAVNNALGYADKAALVAKGVPDCCFTAYVNSADGGRFEWDSTSTDSDNGGAYCGTVFNVTGNVGAGRWVRYYDGETVNTAWFGDMSSLNTDKTSVIQAALHVSKNVYVEDGAHPIDPAVGLIIVHEGTTLFGSSRQKCAIYAKNSNAGSLIKRAWNEAPGTNEYLRDVIIRDIAVLHESDDQIGIDYRNFTRSIVRDIAAGTLNVAVTIGVRPDDPSQSDARLGHGIILGNVQGGEDNYAGGEVNTIEGTKVYGTRKAITVDDLVLSPLSASYAANIRNNDIQVCESGIAFESQYNAGSEITGNVVQSVGNTTGSSNTTYAYRIAGRDCYLRNKYIEVTIGDCDHILKLESTAKRNMCDLGLIGNDDLFVGLITDSGGWGNHNRINYSLPSTNRLVTLDGGIDAEIGRDSARVLFDGTSLIGNVAETLGRSMGTVNVTRDSIGDFSHNFTTNTFPDANYTYSIDFQINTGGAGGSCTVRVQNSTNLRVIFRDGTGALVDPIRASIRCG